MFIRKYWIPLLVFSIAIVGVGLYLLAIQQPPETVVIIKPVEPIEESTAEESTAEKPPISPRVEQSQEKHNGTTVEINHEWASLTDEERLQRQKEQNQVFIDTIADLPEQAETYKLMIENEFPYSPEVQVKIQEAQWRLTEKGAAYDAVIAEIDAKMRSPNLSGAELTELTRQRHAAKNRLKGGQ